jgi:hypothetical protein
MIIVVNSLLTFSPEFQAEHFEKSLPSGKSGRANPCICHPVRLEIGAAAAAES